MSVSEQIEEARNRARQLAESRPIKRQLEDASNNSYSPDLKRALNGDDMAAMGMNMMGGGGMPPMGGMGGPMGGMPQQMQMPMQGGQDATMEVLEVPNSTVGLIIGRGGEQISSIQQQSGCRVQMAPDTAATGQARQCTLSGSVEAINRAKSMIMDIVSRAGQRPGAGGGGGGGASYGAGSISVDMPIPANRVGLVIGKGGETIKNLQDRAGCRMQMIREDNNPDAPTKVLRIQGDQFAVENAKKMVEAIVNGTMRADGNEIMGGGGGGGGMGGFGQDAQFMGGGPVNVGEVIVPRASVGMIIGKGGENIKRMAQESGCKIQFKPDEDNTTAERTAILQGSIDSIRKATALITACVTKSTDGGGGGMMGGGGGAADTFYMHVPANKTGLVIGRGGETIKQINQESGAHVELSRNDQPNPNEKVFIIKGTAYQIHHAQHLIRIKVGDIAQGTPVPAMAGQPAISYGQTQMGGQWPQAYAQQTQQDAWPGYFQQQQQQMQPQQQQQFAQAQPAQAQAQGGQADYSREWIEYYRNLGMHDQAAAIEAQTRNGAGQGQRQGQAMPIQQGYAQQAQPQQQQQYAQAGQAQAQPFQQTQQTFAPGQQQQFQ